MVEAYCDLQPPLGGSRLDDALIVAHCAKYTLNGQVFGFFMIHPPSLIETKLC